MYLAVVHRHFCRGCFRWGGGAHFGVTFGGILDVIIIIYAIDDNVIITGDAADMNVDVVIEVVTINAVVDDDLINGAAIDENSN
ncbi:hypothetical protein NDU88_001697 [Pleurodeles waltl]|uniref:Uncharacterized protein n=1 Tax=Pleurodeles waltl TaxID=8319 RepID=A0AAV7U770_PLEWA|nr:hypothetical protein NDU88_001697 [Pleurodeles waltl]